MMMDYLIDSVRGQIRDTKEPYTFAQKTESSPDELELFIKQALVDYSRWNPIKEKPAVINLAAGVVMYDLPEDFISMKEMPHTISHQVIGQKLLLIDVPETSIQIPYIYQASHAPETLPLIDRHCIVWFASSLALRAILSDTKKLDSYVSYNLKDVLQVDAKESNRIITILKDNAVSLEQKYNERIIEIQGAEQNTAAFMTFG